MNIIIRKGVSLDADTENADWLKSTSGRRAYEEDVRARPFYHDGTPRKNWEQLGRPEQLSWSRPTLNADVDPEYQSRIDAERVSAELKTKSNRRLDSGRESIEDSPLFGGPRQQNIFGEG